MCVSKPGSLFTCSSGDRSEQTEAVGTADEADEICSRRRRTSRGKA
jgi:hypothetical protein